MDTERKSHYIFSYFHVCKKIRAIGIKYAVQQASIHDFASFERFIYEHLNNMLDFVLRAVHRATKQLTLFSSHSLEPLKYILHIDFSHVKNYP